MSERKKTYFRLIAEVVCLIVSVALVVVFSGPVIAILLPFLIAFVTAWALNAIIRRLHSRLRLTRKLFSYVLVLVLYAVLFGLCMWFATLLISQVIDLAKAVPTIIAQLQSVYNQLIA